MGSQFSKNVGTSRSSSSANTLTTNLATKASSLSTEVFQQFYSKLVEKLPMDDPNFTAKLYSARLLPSHLKEYVESRSPVTRTAKAIRFLDQVIKPSMTSFTELLSVMEDSEYQHVKELAKQIKTNNQDPPTEQKQSTDNG